MPPHSPTVRATPHSNWIDELMPGRARRRFHPAGAVLAAAAHRRPPRIGGRELRADTPRAARAGLAEIAERT